MLTLKILKGTLVMICVFDDGVTIPCNSRKHRRLDDDPSDGGGSVDSATRIAGGALNQDRIVPKATSYKESLIGA
ncbi:hypothetical protein V6N12_037997 [Hibiscus sabdariffa]|uniref:Uncharacterized protein n=1 Tax=Hibiscus sabdariffa TaxID=183260 RepID=A0ABR2BWD2_9ROSI